MEVLPDFGTWVTRQGDSLDGADEPQDGQDLGPGCLEARDLRRQQDPVKSWFG